jgi:hypothetical protein
MRMRETVGPGGSPPPGGEGMGVGGVWESHHRSFTLFSAFT